MESFFASLKKGLIPYKDQRIRAEAQAGIVEDLGIFDICVGGSRPGKQIPAEYEPAIYP